MDEQQADDKGKKYSEYQKANESPNTFGLFRRIWYELLKSHQIEFFTIR
jgi:hypothetical protein